MLAPILRKIDKLCQRKIFNLEDRPVINFLMKCPPGSSYLESGAGVGRFADIVRSKFNFEIQCLEKNVVMAESLEEKGYKVLITDIASINIEDSKLDIIHCSHVIEHLYYPHIVKALDEMARVLRPNGYLIIRSPLWHSRFLNDIDHIRPYPPEAIINYFTCEQQQHTPQSKFRIISVAYRHWPISVGNDNIFKVLLNKLFQILWIFVRIPRTRKNGYVLIMQKI